MGDGVGLGDSASAGRASATPSATTAQKVIRARRGPTRCNTGALRGSVTTACERDVSATGFDDRANR